MARISEALVATAIGILIAIPAVAAFNWFQRIVRGTVSNTEALGHLLLAHLKSTAAPTVAGDDAKDPATAATPPRKDKPEESERN
jgi:biopolymer transport protein ExbB